MSLVMTGARRRGGRRLKLVGDAPIPYTFPTAAPWNAPQRALVPTYDGSDQPTHPSVVDMVAETGAPWHGYRFWMAHTPYPYADALLENPSVVVSNNGYDWHDTAVGITNPIVPHPGGGNGHYNSDCDLSWDPDRGRLWMLHRTTYPANTCNVLWTEDGLTWTPTKPVTNDGAVGVSPALVRLSATLWRMFYIAEEVGVRYLFYRDATSPEGPWGAAVKPAQPNPDINADTKTIWHLDVNAPVNGIMHGAVVTYPIGRIHPMSSANNGATWVYGPALLSSTAKWDSGWMYRPTLVRDGNDYMIWYPSHGQGSDPTYIGMTRIPRSQWPVP